MGRKKEGKKVRKEVKTSEYRQKVRKEGSYRRKGEKKEKEMKNELDHRKD